MFHANDIVYCRRSGEAFRVIYCHSGIVKLDDGSVRPLAGLTLFGPKSSNDPH